MSVVYISGGSGDSSGWFVVAIAALFIVGPLGLGFASRAWERRRRRPR